jgi:Na+/glutamate symporter
MIPMFGIELPALATAAVVGIVLNLILSIGNKEEVLVGETVETIDEDVQADLA